LCHSSFLWSNLHQKREILLLLFFQHNGIKSFMEINLILFLKMYKYIPTDIFIRVMTLPQSTIEKKTSFFFSFPSRNCQSFFYMNINVFDVSNHYEVYWVGIQTWKINWKIIFLKLREKEIYIFSLLVVAAAVYSIQHKNFMQLAYFFCMS
jgi:hypothetical protein